MPHGESPAVPENRGLPPPQPSALGRGNGLLGLTRPRLGTLGMITVLFSNVLALTSPGPPMRLLSLASLILGGALALSGASALNQYLERHPDALMRRTAGRPLPSGRVSPRVAGLFGLFLTVSGLAVLGIGVGRATAGWTLVGVLSYALIYTPMKPRSSLNTLVGALPGAIPALMGWSASRPLTPDAWVIFGVLALWQVPHFLAIAWLYRADYQRAGFQMLGVPVTWAMYRLFDPGHDAARDDFDGKLPPEAQEEVPVYRVSWFASVMFAEWAGARLPLEPEWEYACRAGTKTRFWSGDTDEDLARVGWIRQNSSGHPHPVAEKPENAWGLHDVYGNVDEWCANIYDGEAYAVRADGLTVDPRALTFAVGKTLPMSAESADRGASRVVRGGSWGSRPEYARSADRGRVTPSRTARS